MDQVASSSGNGWTLPNYRKINFWNPIWHLWNMLFLSGNILGAFCIQPSKSGVTKKHSPGCHLYSQHFTTTLLHFFKIKKKLLGLPWWLSGKEFACQCRERGFEPWSRKIPHVVEQLNPCATTTEPACLEPMLCNKRSHCNEKLAHRKEE